MMIITKTANKPILLIEPPSIKLPINLAQSQGHELIYCTAETASIGIIVTRDTQLAQAAIKPSKEPCVYCA